MKHELNYHNMHKHRRWSIIIIQLSIHSCILQSDCIHSLALLCYTHSHYYFYVGGYHPNSVRCHLWNTSDCGIKKKAANIVSAWKVYTSQNWSQLTMDTLMGSWWLEINVLDYHCISLKWQKGWNEIGLDIYWIS